MAFSIFLRKFLVIFSVMLFAQQAQGAAGLEWLRAGSRPAQRQEQRGVSGAQSRPGQRQAQREKISFNDALPTGEVQAPVVQGVGGPEKSMAWSDLPRDKNNFPSVNGMTVVPVTGNVALDTRGLGAEIAGALKTDPKKTAEAISAGLILATEELPNSPLATALGQKVDATVTLFTSKVEQIGERVADFLATKMGRTTKQAITDIASDKQLIGTVARTSAQEFGKTAETTFTNIVTQEKDVRKLVDITTDQLSKTPFMTEMGTKINKQLEPLFKALDDASHRLTSTVFNFRNARQIALPVMATMSGIAGTWVFWLWAKKRILNPKPTVLLPGANVGWLDQLKRRWNSYKTPGMVFPDQVESRLQELCDKTRNIKQRLKEGKKAEFLNIILDGPPGTGKTLFAQVFADRMDMDFAPLTAGSLLQPGAGVAYLNELMAMADRSSRGVVIFLDEAEALLVDRNTLKKDSEHYLVFNHLLSLIGQGNSKFVFVAATNKKSAIDPAMARRFQERVNMPLPNEKSRHELFKLYTNELLFNVSANGEKFVQAAKALITTATMNELVLESDGLSGSEIKDSVKSMRDKAFISKDGLLKTEHVMSAVQECIAKKKAFEDGIDY